MTVQRIGHLVGHALLSVLLFAGVFCVANEHPFWGGILLGTFSSFVRIDASGGTVE